MATYTKLGNLINDQFTVESVGKPTYKKWDSENGQMLTSATPQEGYRKVYPVATDKGQLDLGSGQLGNILAEVIEDGQADVRGRTFSVKSNGKTGQEIRYFLNVVRPTTVSEEGDASLDSIDF